MEADDIRFWSERALERQEAWKGK
ncbi:hypothetical protein [Desulfovibrio africanus]